KAERDSRRVGVRPRPAEPAVRPDRKTVAKKFRIPCDSIGPGRTRTNWTGCGPGRPRRLTLSIALARCCLQWRRASEAVEHAERARAIDDSRVEARALLPEGLL